MGEAYTENHIGYRDYRDPEGRCRLENCEFPIDESCSRLEIDVKHPFWLGCGESAGFSAVACMKRNVENLGDPRDSSWKR